MAATIASLGLVQSGELPERGSRGGWICSTHLTDLWLVRLGNESYEGTFPPRAAFKPQEILDKDRKEHFERWYADNSKKFQPHTDLKWSFMQQARTVWVCTVPDVWLWLGQRLLRHRHSDFKIGDVLL